MKKIFVLLFALIVSANVFAEYEWGLNVVSNNKGKYSVILRDEKGKTMPAVFSQVNIDFQLENKVIGWAKSLPIGWNVTLNATDDYSNGYKLEHKFSIKYDKILKSCIVDFDHYSYKEDCNKYYSDCLLYRLDHGDKYHIYIVFDSSTEYVFAAYIDSYYPIAFVHTCTYDEFFKDLSSYLLN
mgnify:CR=1 FL=1